MERHPTDPAESTVTLLQGDASSPRVFLSRVGLLAMLGLLGYLVWRIVSPVLQPIVWALLLGALLAPLTLKLSRRLGDKPRLAAVLVTVLTLLFFLLPIAVIAGAVAAQAAQLLGRLETRMPSLETGAALDVSHLPWLQQAVDWIGQNTGVTLLQMQEWVVNGARNLLQVIVSSGGSVVLGALGTLVSFLLMLFVLFFVLRDGPQLAGQVVRMLPIEEQRRSRLYRHLIDVTRAVFMGIGLTALAQGILLGIGFAFAGLPSPLVFGVLGIFFALIPIVGTGLLWVPGALWLAAQGDYGHAGFLAGWSILVVGGADNFLRPMLISGRAEVPTLAVFVGVMGGLSAFGFIGLFLGPIVLGLLVALFRFESEELESKKEGV